MLDGIVGVVGGLVDASWYTDQEKAKDANLQLAAQAQIEAAKAQQLQAQASAGNQQSAMRIGVLALGGVGLIAGAWVLVSVLRDRG